MEYTGQWNILGLALRPKLSHDQFVDCHKVVIVWHKSNSKRRQYAQKDTCTLFSCIRISFAFSHNDRTCITRQTDQILRIVSPTLTQSNKPLKTL
jgi:hypothetical protein